MKGTSLLALVAVVALATDAAAQTRAAVASPTRPRPLVTRPMGLPASVQTVGQPAPPPPPGAYPPHGHLVYFYPYLIPVPRQRPYPMFYDPQPVPAPVPVPRARMTTSPPVGPTGCAVVELVASGERWRNLVPLPTLGADTPDGLRAVLARLLAGGQQVPLETLNGTRVVIPGGFSPAELTVEPCGGPT